MHTSNPVTRWAVSIWVALSLLAAPWVASAAAAPANVAPAAVHAAHDGSHAAGIPHADHAKISPQADTGSYPNTSCAKHEQCGGKCCTACAQCFTATSSVSASFAVVLATYTPVVPRLHDRLVTAPHDRPPAA